MVLFGPTGHNTILSAAWHSAALGQFRTGSTPCGAIQPLVTFHRVPSEDCRTFSFRLYPTVRQQNALEHLLDLQRELYNAALEARRGGWGQEKRSTSYVDDCRVLTELREVRPEVLADGVVVCRRTLKWLDRSFASFYRRCQRGEKPG